MTVLHHAIALCEQILLERCKGNTADHLAFEATLALQQAIHDESAKQSTVTLASAFGLGWHEQVVLWMCAATQVDRTVKSLFAQAMGETTCATTASNLRFAVYGRQTSTQAWRDLSTSGTLRSFALLEASREGDEDSPLRLPAAVLARLHGASALDELGHWLGVVTARPLAELTIAEASRLELQKLVPELDESHLVLVQGRIGSGGRTVASALAAERGHMTLRIDCGRLASDVAEVRRQLRAAARECRLERRAPLFDNLHVFAEAERWRAFQFALDLFAGPVFAASHSELPKLDGDRQLLAVTLRAPEVAKIADCWESSLGQGTRGDAEMLAGAYPMAPALIVRASAAAKALAGAGNRLQPDHVFGGIRSVLDDQLGAHAKRIEVAQDWDDLVLPADQLAAIVDLTSRIRERQKVYEQWGFASKVGKGLGVSALFSGPPGTGKTMVAQLIAKELGLELYQVDLAKLVSKWVGETEKNLSALFDAAESCFAILLFDEADALFGKRTDVKSSNDRYANFETNYLLQRLESYTGICLLTTNHESNMDPAFQRRLSLHLRFAMPDAEERRALWAALLPEAAPVDPHIDLDELSRRFVMSGGYIRNAALRAAFMAAGEQQTIGHVHLERAARLEYEAMGKIV